MVTFIPGMFGVKITPETGVLSEATNSTQFWWDYHSSFQTLCTSVVHAQGDRHIVPSQPSVACACL